MHQNLETRTFLWCLLLVSAGFLWLLKPFFGPVFWASVIGLLFQPLQQQLQLKFAARPNLVALLTLLICLVIVIIPLIFLISAVANEAIALYDKIKAGEINPGQHLDKLRSTFPAIQTALERIGIDTESLAVQAKSATAAVGGSLAQHTLSLGQNTFGFVLDVCLMLYLAFFVLRDGHKIVDLLVLALPLGDIRERMLFAKFAEVTRATIKGNLVVAMVQGALGGLIFWALGIPSAILWGVLMTIASLIPAVGCALIWAPVALYLLATNSYVHGLILVGYGIAVIGLVDNILRPVLVGRDTKLPDYLVLLSTLGGLALFGINGFVLGPLVAALFMAFWGIFIREFQEESLGPTDG